MTNISAIILTKNSEELIGDCLESVKFCDEVIVIDDGSTDRTPEIAKLLGAKVYPLVARSFSERHNFGARKAKGKWILYVDSDERISEELKENILNVVRERHSGDESQRGLQNQDSGRAPSSLARMTRKFVAYKLQRKNFYFGKHEWPQIERLERLFKKKYLEGWHGDLHETPKVQGEIAELEGFLLHYTHRDLTSMVKKTVQWSQVEAELRYKARHPKMSWWRFYRVMATAFYDSYVKQKGYKAGTAGLVESMYQAFSMFITYARLWEMQQVSSKK